MIPSYIDTHCHLDFILERMNLSSMQTVRERCFPPELEAVVTVCCETASLGPTMEMLGYEGIYAAFGLHPHDASGWSAAVEKSIRSALDHAGAVAWGETGLDFHYDRSPRAIQRRVFIRQIHGALECKKPLVIHSREAEQETFAVLRDHVPADWPLHLHCFTGTDGFAERLLEAFGRLYIGFTGVITFDNAGALRDTVRAVPLERILLETDAPFMAPRPHRGKICHPGHIPLIAEAIARIKEIPVENVYRNTRENTRDLYGV